MMARHQQRTCTLLRASASIRNRCIDMVCAVECERGRPSAHDGARSHRQVNRRHTRRLAYHRRRRRPRCRGTRNVVDAAAWRAIRLPEAEPRHSDGDIHPASGIHDAEEARHGCWSTVQHCRIL